MSDQAPIEPETYHWGGSIHSIKVPQRDPSSTEGVVVFMLALATSNNHPLSKGAKILDFGCGIGDSVKYLLENGYDAYGIDIVEYWDSDFDAYWEAREKPGAEFCKRLYKVDVNDYRIPFPDETFDFVFSNYVFEHVFDYKTALRELTRILKKGAISIHMFPDLFTLIEGHTFVPIIPLCKRKWWLTIWALIGRRAPYQKGLNWRKVVDLNIEEMENTNYLSRKTILRLAKQEGIKISFIGGPMPLNHLSERTRKIYNILDKFGIGDFATSLVRPFISGRLMVSEKK